ncbi:MAG TPA: NADP-dependent oxidoreductase [Myxococcales bacterium]|nr:NADP-dependent oxidoreductase [Myxococcales bacterium]
MKAAAIDRYGGNEVVVVRDVPAPSPGPGQVLVTVHAAGVNPVDFKIRGGKLRAVRKVKFPFILGNEVSGVVSGLGPGADRFKPGDEVFARLSKLDCGGFAEQVAVDQELLARKPARLSHPEAAGLPLAGLTAWQALVDIAGLKGGESVLIHAGAGGVGSLAIQIARHLGAKVFTTASSGSRALVESLGASRVIDYRTERFEEVARGADVVFDTMGGETLERSFLAVKRGGRVVSINGRPDVPTARELGLPGPMVAVLGLLGIPLARRARRAGAMYRYLFMHPDGAQLQHLADLVESGALRPVMDRTFPLDQTADALAYVEAGKAHGKVVLTVR